MDKKIKNAAIMMIGPGLNAFIGFLTVPLITRIVSSSDYGEFSILQTYIGIVVALSLLGLDQAYVRYYYQVDTTAYKSYLTQKVILAPMIISIVGGAAFAILSKRIVSVSYIQPLLLLCIIVTVFETFTRLNLRMEQDSKVYVTVLILHRIVYAVVAVVLVVFVSNQDVVSLMIATVLSLMVAIIVALISKRHIWFGRSKSLLLADDIKKISNRVLLSYSIPFVFSSILNWLFNATGKIALQHYSTYSDIGYYSVATNIVSLITIFQTTFSTIWVPLAVEHYKKDPNEKSFFVKSNDVACIGMIAIGTVVVLLKDVIGWILGGDYVLAGFIFPCLVLHPVLFTISETTVYGINFCKKTYWHIIITVASCVVNILGNAWLTPVLGSKGAAISSGLSYIVFLTLRTVLSNKYYKVNFHYNKMIYSIVLFVAFCLYSTFYSSGLLLVLFFLVICTALLFIYKDCIHDLIAMIKNALKQGGQLPRNK